MKGGLVSKLVKLGFLPSSTHLPHPGSVPSSTHLPHAGSVPSSTHLPHAGSVLMRNLQRRWVEEETRGKALLVEPPDSDTGLLELAAENGNRSVCFIRNIPVTTTNTTNTTNTTANTTNTSDSPSELCAGFSSLSQLGFVDEASLHHLHFYNHHTRHAGFVEFERRRRECRGVSYLLNTPGEVSVAGGAVSVEVSGEEVLEFVYRNALPLQHITLHTISDHVVIETVTYLCRLYLVVLLDKFLSAPPSASSHQAPPSAPFHPHLAPYQVAVIPSQPGNQDMDRVAGKICEMLSSSGVVSLVLPSHQHSGDLGIPFDVLVDESCVRKEVVSLLDRGQGTYHNVPDIHKLPEIFRLYWNSVIR